MNIFERIRQDHDKQRKLLDEMLKTEGASAERKTLYNSLKKELKAHEDVEERCFYIPLIQDDRTQELARHGVAEHHEIDELLEKLDETEMSTSAWLVYAKQLDHQVRHHLDDEEHGVFQMAGKVLTESQKTALAEQFDNAKKKSLS